MKNKNPFTEEFDEYDTGRNGGDCIDYYFGTEGFTVSQCLNPENIWTVLDRMHSDICSLNNHDEISKEDFHYLTDLLGKLMNIVEPECREQVNK